MSELHRTVYKLIFKSSSGPLTQEGVCEEVLEGSPIGNIAAATAMVIKVWNEDRDDAVEGTERDE